MKLFRKKTKKEKWERAYRKKLEEAHKMSTISRAKSDQLIAEADQILKKIEEKE